MTFETLAFLRDLLARQQISVGASDFVEVTRIVVKALIELDEALAAFDGSKDVVM